MEEELVTLQISAEYREKLRKLAQNHKRSMKSEFEVIVDAALAETNRPKAPSFSAGEWSTINKEGGE